MGALKSIPRINTFFPDKARDNEKFTAVNDFPSLATVDVIKIVLPFVSLVIMNSILVLKVLKDSAIAVLLPFVITMLEFFSPSGILPI